MSDTGFCRCKEPGCGILFAFVPGVTASRECCYFCTQRKRREALAAAEESGDPVDFGDFIGE